jgi:hypothetical protein
MPKYTRLILSIAAISVACASCTRQPNEDPQVAQLKQELEATKKELADKQAAAQAQAGAAVEDVKRAADDAAAATAKAASDQTAALAQQKAEQQADTQKKTAAQNTAIAKNKTAIDDNKAGIAENRAGVAENKAAVAKQAEAHEQLKQDVDSMKSREFIVPAHTVISARTTSEIGTSKYKNGSIFDAVLEHDLVVDGTTLAEQGALVHCVVVSADSGGRVKGRASLSVAARTIAGVGGNTITVRTESYTVEAASTKKKDTARGAIATGAGAIIGGIAGGGKGAAIGAGAGAAAGVGTAMATKGAAAVIPTETLIAFTLSAPATVVLRQ